jgi:CBS domain-containing protein
MPPWFMSQNGSTMKTTIGSRRWRHLAMIAMAQVILGVDDPGVPDHSEPLPLEECACGGATPSWVYAPCVTGIETGRSVPEGGLFQEVIMFARDVMTPEAEWIAPDLSLAEVGRIMRDKCIGCLPVGENDRLIGIITDRDLACRAVADGLDPTTTQARQVMTQGITWCFEDQSLDDIAQVMEQKQIHHLPVLNSQKRMVGIVSLSDLALRGTFGATDEVARLASRDTQRHAALVH